MRFRRPPTAADEVPVGPAEPDVATLLSSAPAAPATDPGRHHVTAPDDVSPAIFPWIDEPPAPDTMRVVAVDRDHPLVLRVAEADRWPRGADVGMLVARVVLAVVGMLAGARVLFGLPVGGGGGIDATAAALAGHGFVATGALAHVVGWALLVAGVLVGLGVFASPAASALLAVAVAAFGVTVPAVFTTGAISPAEGALSTAALAAVVVLAGPGRHSGDSGRPWARRQTAVGVTFFALGLATGLTVLFGFR